MRNVAGRAMLGDPTVFSFPACVYVGTLNLIALIPDPFILTSHDSAKFL